MSGSNRGSYNFNKGTTSQVYKAFQAARAINARTWTRGNDNSDARPSMPSSSRQTEQGEKAKQADWTRGMSLDGPRANLSGYKPAAAGHPARKAPEDKAKGNWQDQRPASRRRKHSLLRNDHTTQNVEADSTAAQAQAATHDAQPEALPAGNLTVPPQDTTRRRRDMAPAPATRAMQPLPAPAVPPEAPPLPSPKDFLEAKEIVFESIISRILSASCGSNFNTEDSPNAEDSPNTEDSPDTEDSSSSNSNFDGRPPIAPDSSDDGSSTLEITYPELSDDELSVEVDRRWATWEDDTIGPRFQSRLTGFRCKVAGLEVDAGDDYCAYCADCGYTFSRGDEQRGTDPRVGHGNYHKYQVGPNDPQCPLSVFL